MNRSELDAITSVRLHNQAISFPHATSVGELIKHLGAMQAQDYPGALWSLGLRLPGLTKTDIEQAITDREIIRTWPMRGTLHFVPADDARWMLELLAPRRIAAMAYRRRQLELDDDTIERGRQIVTAALQGGNVLTRDALCIELDRQGVSPAGQRGIHILQQMSQEQILCFGPHEAKQPTFVLLDEWVPHKKTLERDEALAELARRYFTSHNPATFKDFAWWTGLTMGDAKLAVELAGPIKSEPVKTQPSPTAYLLPGFDEYLLGYADRNATLPSEHAEKIVPGGNGMFLATIVIDGQVSGTWKKVVKAKSIVIKPEFFAPMTIKHKQALSRPAEDYAKFMGLPVTIEE